MKNVISQTSTQVWRQYLNQIYTQLDNRPYYQVWQQTRHPIGWGIHDQIRMQIQDKVSSSN
jgi:hypothetical protein